MESKKIDLAEEAFRRIYQIAVSYKNQTEQLENENKQLEITIEKLKYDLETARQKEMAILTERESQNARYLKSILNDIDDLKEKILPEGCRDDLKSLEKQIQAVRDDLQRVIYQQQNIALDQTDDIKLPDGLEKDRDSHATKQTDKEEQPPETLKGFCEVSGC